ncbi:unnamed protein product [Trichobilharzia regenti]|nr:unnamed protein product [Trichobilharzia regenti]
MPKSDVLAIMATQGITITYSDQYYKGIAIYYSFTCKKHSDKSICLVCCTLLLFTSTDIIRTTRCFSAKGSCSHRVYDYLLPTFALSPSSFSTSLNDSSCWNYRVTAEQITRANHLLGRYQGTHNFYNFTSGSKLLGDVQFAQFKETFHHTVSFGSRNYLDHNMLSAWYHKWQLRKQT